MIQPTFSPINCVGHKQTETRVKAETSFNIDEQIKKPISVKARAFLTSVLSENGNVKARAKVVFYFVYLSEDGYKKTETETEVNVEFPVESATVSVAVCDTKLVSLGIGASTTVIFYAESKTYEERNCISGGDGIIIKEKTEEFDIYYQGKDGRQTVTDEFELNYLVGEVLAYSSEAYVNEVVSGLGRIIFDGETVLTLKVLPYGENSDIIKERRVIPFRYEMEISDAMPEMRACGKVDVISTNLKVFADENKNKSLATADIALLFSGEAISAQSVSLCDDAYLKDYHSDLNYCEFDMPCFVEQKCLTQKISQSAGAGIDGGRIITVFGESLSVYGIKVAMGSFTVDGIVRCDVVFKNSDNGVSVVNAEIPFSLDVSVNGNATGIKVCLVDLNAKLINGDIVLDAQLKVCYKSIIVKKIKCVDGISEKDRRNSIDCAITVYVPKNGDDVWDVAKEIGATEEDVIAFNPDLEFPLSEDERVVIYRQKN